MEQPTSNVIVFTKAFGESKTTFTYAALRVDDKWYITGSRAPQGLSWEDLLLWAKPVSLLVYEPAPSQTYSATPSDQPAESP